MIQIIDPFGDKLCIKCYENEGNMDKYFIDFNKRKKLIIDAKIRSLLTILYANSSE